MRYAKCTPDDIAFLKSRIAPQNSEIFKKPEFRNVSIITATNKVKDSYNEVGAERFAADTRQELHHFYSTDKLRPGNVGKKQKRGRPKSKKSKQQVMTEGLQKQLWDVPPASVGHIPGKLAVCLGMPVLIRNNDATELCITKGQEGLVAGWTSSIGPYDMPILETLFVKLINPPSTVNIEGLEENVVPITRTKTKKTAVLGTDKKLSIEREQVNILPNFSMTDYSSQGKTRNYNVVDLADNSRYHGMYTSLSRGTSAEGTVILGTFDDNIYKITQGLSKAGFLRQEFRELNLLDEITRLRYEDKLPKHVNADLRYPLIQAYMEWKKNTDMIEQWHAELKVTSYDELIPQEAVDDTEYLWKSEVMSKQPLEQRKKRMQDIEDQVKISKTMGKKMKSQDSTTQSISDQPRGVLWDSVDYSCGYDSLLVILFSIWKDNALFWGRKWRSHGGYISQISAGFAKVLTNQSTIEEVRNALRSDLRQKHPERFPHGSAGIYISDLIPKVIPDIELGHSTIECPNCRKHSTRLANNFALSAFTVINANQYRKSKIGDQYSIEDALYTAKGDIRQKCAPCKTNYVRQLTVDTQTDLICFGIDDTHLKIKPLIHLPAGNSHNTYRLKGLIYGGGQHFTSRIVDNHGQVFYADGLQNGRECIFERTLMASDDGIWLKTCKGRILLYVVYENMTMLTANGIRE
ncbi:hypothetical protein DFP72DRAFT_798033 [Ephemerocybe angulata]|uniref:Uncharacterized protein n=1 Tax=Ephemerocybe angulata TaxID=980116 RepID=A0A8H6MGD1_9AGAR|nr:hypothetical protein DFP72DRAFT_798033 [Tulosesus angulatus]